jgi:23S rRNA pseudouridine1911/1915/1917 synthase
MVEQQHFSATVPAEMAGLRLDQALASLFQQFSRSRLQSWVRNGRLLVDGKTARPRDKVWGGEVLQLTVVPDRQEHWQAQAIPLEIVYEDEAIIVLNKPAGLVVHPAAGNREGTLLNALLHHAPELEGVPRAGIVHRLDKDTSGLLVVARTLTAQKKLVEQMQARHIRREYLALVNGVLVAGGTVDAPLGRHPVDRKRMAIVPSGKPAVTHYRIKERFAAHTLLDVQLETGRTHQIRVHMASIHHPLVGDPVYGGRLRIPKGAGEQVMHALRNFKRQALHAASLGLEHPLGGEWVEWRQPLPEDMDALLDVLRMHQREVS